MAHIVIDSNKCKGCYFCIQSCPKQIIEISGDYNSQGYFPASVIPNKAEECNGCKTCAVMCPDIAIEVYK